jgi:branched-chain amino acid transport system permease protein
MGPIVFVVVVFGGLGSLLGCFIASILMGMIQTFAVVINYSMLDLLKPLGVTLSDSNLFTEIMAMPVARIGALLPFAMMIVILLFRPRGLLGTRDT